MYTSSSSLLSAAVAFIACATGVRATASETIDGFHVIWEENFAESSLDLTRWNQYTGVPSNNEQETYPADSDNCRFTGSSLLIVPELSSAGAWTSCRIETIDSFTAPVGGQIIVQARFKLGTPGTSLQGIWPAFWSIGEAVRHGTQWPACGEIDTFENLNGASLGFGTLHCGAACNDNTGLSAGITFDYGTFHTWAHAIDRRSDDWTQGSIIWYMDGQPYHWIKAGDLGEEAWKAVGESAMYPQLNVAVGGDLAGMATAATMAGIGAGMEVQYVAIYQSN